MLFHLILHLNNFSFPFNESIANTILLDVSNIYLIKFEIPITLILFILILIILSKLKKDARKVSTNRTPILLIQHPKPDSLRFRSNQRDTHSKKFEYFFVGASLREKRRNQVGDTFLKAV